MKDIVFINQLNTLKSKISKEIDALMLEYVKDKRLYMDGTILKTKGNHLFVVDGIKYHRPYTLGNSSQFPLISYYGRELTQKLKPRKDNSIIHRCSGIEKVGTYVEVQ